MSDSSSLWSRSLVPRLLTADRGPRRLARAAGQDGGGTGGAGESAARQAFLWPCRRGHEQLGAELFKYMAHVDIAPVPYRGTTAECKYETGSLDCPASR
jgi:hypothetical protein